MTLPIAILLGTVMGLILGNLQYGDDIRHNAEKEIENKIESDYYDE